MSPYGFERRRFGVRLIGAAALVAAFTACDIGTVTVPKTAASVVVHGVLNPGASSQLVLLERTLNGAINIKDTPFDATDPIVSAGGVPISGATVEIVDSTGHSVAAVEDITVLKNGKGAGVYRVPISGGALVVGAKYTLRIHTPQNEVVTADTRIPRAISRSTGALSRTLNRDRDTMLIAWSPVAGARSYAVRIESPFGPFFLFTDSTRFVATGSLRNLFASDLQHVFIPGFRQDVLIGAVDSNFYDYYRTNNDPFTGSGVISRINGGIGLFGSIVTLNSGTITVTANQTEPVEGRFRAVPVAGTATVLSQVVLYLESVAAHDNLPSSISGRYTTAAPNSRSDGIIGEQLGANLTLTLLANQLAGDTVDVFTGELRGDTISGSYRTTGAPAVFVRSP